MKIAASAACVMVLSWFGVLVIQQRALLADRLPSRPTEKDEAPLVFWTEPAASGLGQFTTVRLDLHSPDYALNVWINPPPKSTADDANSRLEPAQTMCQVAHFLVGINATPFTLPGKTPAETEVWKSFLPGQPVFLRGFAKARDEAQVGDGPAAPSYPVLWEDSKGEVGMTSIHYPTDMVWGLSAYHWLVKNGQIHVSAKEDPVRKYRSCAGLSPDGRWLYLVSCGPLGAASSRHDAGASNTELAEYLIELGVDRALNFDGGSSSSLLIRQPDGWLTFPPPKHLIARPVPVMIGISAR